MVSAGGPTADMTVIHVQIQVFAPPTVMLEIPLVLCRATGKNQASCELPASNSVYGDPCVGTFKYLEVKYQCIGGNS